MVVSGQDEDVKIHAARKAYDALADHFAEEPTVRCDDRFERWMVIFLQIRCLSFGRIRTFNKWWSSRSSTTVQSPPTFQSHVSFDQISPSCLLCQTALCLWRTLKSGDESSVTLNRFWSLTDFDDFRWQFAISRSRITTTRCWNECFVSSQLS